MFLEEITGKIQLEDNKFECKSRLNREDIIGWLQTIAGFANASGGEFYIGVEDKTNKLIGFDRKDADNERNYFNNIVNEHLVPRPRMGISFLSYQVREKERYIIQILIPESAIKPVILKYKGIPSIFMRRDGFTNGATYEEIIEMSIKSKNTQYDVLDSDKKYEYSNFSELRKFYEEHNNGDKLGDKALQSMGFYDADGYLANGATLFEDGYKGNKTAINCSVFSGINRGTDRLVTMNRFNGNIIESVSYIMDFVRQRMNHAIVKQNDGRVNIDAYPERALFEGVINAVAHRDYFLDGTQIQVDMFRDRLEISSPGGLYRGEQYGKTYDLTKIISKRRNEVISAVLVKCNVMEAAGTGFEKIAEEYSNADEKHQPYIYSTSDHFTLVLPDLTYDSGVTESGLPELADMPIANGTKYDQKLLSYCFYRAHSVSEIAEFLEVSNSSYLRIKVIKNLVDQGYLEANKSGRTAYYKTVRSSVSLA